MSGTVTVFYDGIGEMLRSDFMVAEMERRAEKVRAVAVATAPVDASSDHPGRYKESFAVSSAKHGGIHKDRAQAIVSNDAPEALYVEYGTKHNPRRATLRNALTAARD